MLIRLIFFIFILLVGTPVFSQKYKKIHEDAVLVDTHNDFPSASIQKKVSFDADLLGKTHSDLARMRTMSPEAVRKYLGDGNFGGYYERPDADMLAIWSVAVAETRELLEQGWR